MVGTSILDYLIKNFPGMEMRAAYHNNKPFIHNERVQYVSGDFKSLDDCRQMVRGCDLVIMAASYAGGAQFVRSFPWEHMNENLKINMQLLEAFRLENVQRVIFISSTAVYQEFDGSIKEEEIDFNKDPHAAYFGLAWGMRFIEKLYQFLHMQYGIEIIIARAANIFGPYDKFDPKFSNFIPAIIRKAVDKMDPFEVWGTPDVTRDVIYSEDFTRAILMMADNDEIKFDIFNIGSGAMTTVANVVEWVLKFSGHKPSVIKYIQNKPTTIKFRALNCAKAKALLGWEPRYSIEEGIKITTEWWDKNKEKWKR